MCRHFSTPQLLRVKQLMPFSCFALILISLIGCSENTPENRAKEQTTMIKDSMISRGKYLVSIMDCNECHTPKKMGPNGPELDLSRMLSGHPADMPLGDISSQTLKSWILFNQITTAIAGPWGVSFTANLTPDDTGLGNWTEEQFLIAIRKGKYKGMENGRDLLPPMPWQAYRNATDEDLKSVFAYLQSIPKVSNRVPPPVSPEDLNKMAK